MKKSIAILMMLLAVIMVGCNDLNKVWLLEIGQTKAEVEKILKNHNYRYKDNEDKDGFDGNQVVEYLGIEFDGFMLTFKDDKLVQISFRKADGEELTEEDAEKVVKQLDERFGEHREDRTAAREYGTIGWTWEKDNINVSFTRMFGGSMSLLTFYQNNHVNENADAPKKDELVEEVVDLDEVWEIRWSMNLDSARSCLIEKDFIPLSLDNKNSLSQRDANFQYMGIRWSDYRIQFDDSNQHIKFIELSRNEHPLSDSEKKTVLNNLDKRFGNHTYDDWNMKGPMYHYETWTWNKDGYEVELSCGEDGFLNMISLTNK